MPTRRAVATAFGSVLLLFLALVAAPASAGDLPDSLSTTSAALAEEPPSQPVLCNGLAEDGEAPVGSNAPTDQGVTPGAYFSYLKLSAADQTAIRNRVLNTIKSTNGRYCAPTGSTDASGNPLYTVEHGSVKLASWSWNDWAITEALKAARARGVSVQAIAARNINEKGNESGPYQPWVGAGGMRRSFDYYSDTVPSGLLDDENSWVHDCAGACRGGGGIAHAKYFLFQDVRSGAAGSEHVRDLVVQTSMNLTTFAYKGQWNQAKVMTDAESYADFRTIFYEAAQQSVNAFARWDHGTVSDIFFPKHGAPDPTLRLLDSVDCSGRTPVRVINYAIYDDRGLALARKLRGLWGAGCDVKVIYSLSTRPVLRILRSRAGRGPIPVKQTVLRNRSGEIVKYNHSKWVSVGDRVEAGSANWSNNAWTGDEQMQDFDGAGPFRDAFNRTWNQGISRAPRGGRLGEEIQDAPLVLRWGHGELRHLTPEG